MSIAEQARATAQKEAILAVLRRHTIGAFNGSQVLCAAPACRTWMTTDNWHQHVAARVLGVANPGKPQ